MNNGNSGYESGHRQTNRTTLTILGIVVIALICITVITLVSMGKRLWGDVAGNGTAAVTDIARSGAAVTNPTLSNASPGTVSPSTGSNGNGANAANPGNIISGLESAGDAADAGAETAGDAVDAAAPDTGDASDAAAEVGAAETADASEAGAQPAAPVLDDSTPVFTAPVYGAIAKSHDDSVAVYSLTMDDYRVHLGVDIGANLGDSVYCCADGVVASVTNDPFMGTCVSVDHGNGYVSYYKNLAAELPTGVVVGMAVTSGQIIGAVGETAALEIADSTHLHFELTVNGTEVNPCDYMSFPEATAQTFGNE